MDLELLVIPDRPHQTLFEAAIRRSLTDIGLPWQPIHTRMITSTEQAEQVGFIGSPTILIDGVDPFADPGRPAGPCRIYRTPTGQPDATTLRRALKSAAEARPR